jgi:activator of HSP90 ATPase
MAKIGEGDSRWIVSRRADGKNVDNWHWTEKDLFPWCQDQFETKFRDVSIPSPVADLKITKTESVTGSMIVCNRKGKTIFVFDVVLKLEWTGKASSSDGTEISGKGMIVVDNIANDEDKWKISVRMESESAANRFLKEELQSKGKNLIDNIINNVLEDMKAKIVDEGAKISSVVSSTKTEPVAQVKPPEPKPTAVKPASQSTPTSSSSGTRSFVQKILFEAPLEHLYRALTDQNGVSAFTGAPAKIDNKVGGEFFILDGAIRGTLLEITPKKIVQKWRFQTWPENHYSTVTWSFSEEKGGCLISLTQTDIPSADLERTRSGWERFFWQGIRNAFNWTFTYQ